MEAENKPATCPGALPRIREPELMDDPSLDERLHIQALRGLSRLNSWSGGASAIWKPILSLARSAGRSPIKILDIATGGGDIPLELWTRARRAGIALELAACDLSARA